MEKVVPLDDVRPSGFYRTIGCPGSRRMTVRAPQGGGSSIYAKEGSAAHTLCSQSLLENRIPLEYWGDTIREEGVDFKVNREMVIHCTTFVEHCRVLQRKAQWEAIEERLTIPSLDMRKGGTGDYVAVVGSELHVVDLKYGKGVYVNEQGNSQFASYGWGALNTMPEHLKPTISTIHMTCIQPRHSAGNPIRTWKIGIADMDQWLTNIAIPAVEASRKPDAPLVPGDHCKFCDAAGFCTAPLQRMAELMKGMPE